MLIGEFARRTGLSQDTIRFYVRKGLLAPETSVKGGRNPYQIFSEREVATARMIRFTQALGLPLKEVAEAIRELQAEGISAEREAELLEGQILRLEKKAEELAALIGYLRAKRDWVSGARSGEAPRFLDTVVCLAEVAPLRPASPGVVKNGAET